MTHAPAHTDDLTRADLIDLVTEIGHMIATRAFTAHQELEERDAELRAGGGSFAARIRAQGRLAEIEAVIAELTVLIELPAPPAHSQQETACPPQPA